MKEILYVILDQWADWEPAYLSTAVKTFGNNLYINRTVSLTSDPVESIGGFRVTPDYDINSIPENYEALILVGGMSWRNKEAELIKPLVQNCFKSGKILGGICDATFFLASTGVLNGVKHTGNGLNSLKPLEIYTGENNYIEKQAVNDKNVITANGSAPLEFAREILISLDIAEENEINEWYKFNKIGFYKSDII